jgi:hypothetical protein
LVRTPSISDIKFNFSPFPSTDGFTYSMGIIISYHPLSSITIISSFFNFQNGCCWCLLFIFLKYDIFFFIRIEKLLNALMGSRVKHFSFIRWDTALNGEPQCRRTLVQDIKISNSIFEWNLGVHLRSEGVDIVFNFTWETFHFSFHDAINEIDFRRHSNKRH